MQRLCMSGLALWLVSFALFPIAVLMLAAGLGMNDARPNGISAGAFAHWRFPPFSNLNEPANDALWHSLERTVIIAITASLLVSTVTITSAYLLTRRSSRWAGSSAKLLALAAYGLPSVFLLFAFEPARVALDLPADVAVWLLHLVYILPMAALLTVAYAEAHTRRLDRAAALDGASWPRRFWLAYRGSLWRGHLGVFAIGVFISWGDVAFSRQLLTGDSKLLVDLYILRYFDLNTTTPDYAGAALFSLVLISIAVVLAAAVAATTRRGA